MNIVFPRVSRILALLVLTFPAALPPVAAQEILPVLSTSPVRVVEGHNGTHAIGVPLYLSAPSTAAVTVSWTTEDGTAVAGSDYTAASGTATFAPGEVFQTVAVEITGDTTDEFDEILVVRLSSPSGATLGDASAKVMIQDDETPTSVQLPPSPFFAEPAGALFPPALTVTNPSPSRSADLLLVSGTATAGTDVALTQTSLDLTVGSAPLPVQPIDDALTELDETFSLTVTNAGPGVRLLPSRLEQTLATALPASSVALSGDVMATVDGADLKILRRSAGIWEEEATFPATPEGGVHSVAMDQDWLAADFQQTGVKLFTHANGAWTLAHSIPRAPAEADPRRLVLLQDDTLVIGDPAPPGQSTLSGEVRVHERHHGGRNAWGLRQVIAPAAVQPDFGLSLALWGDLLVVGAPESYTVNLFRRDPALRSWAGVREFVRFQHGFGSTFATDGNALVMYAGNSPRYLLTSRPSGPGGTSWSEPVAQPFNSFTLNPRLVLQSGILSGYRTPTSLIFANASATGYWNQAGLLETGTSPATAPPVWAWDGTTAIASGPGDSNGTPLLIFRGPTADATLVDDESVLFTIDSATVTGGGYVKTTARLSRPLPIDVSLPVSSVPDTALEGSDFQALNGNLTFPAGATTATLQFFVHAPEAGEGAETFLIRQSPPPRLGNAGPDAVITIRAAAVLPTLDVGNSPRVFAEGHAGTVSATITVALSGPAPAPASFGWYTVEDTAKAATDFVANDAGVVNIPAGAVSVSWTVGLTGDTLGEADEQFYIWLTDLEGVKLPEFPPPRITVRIMNDDTGTPVADMYTISQGTSLTGVNVRDNDLRIDRVYQVEGPATGTLVLTDDGTVNFTPPPNFTGRITFRYGDYYPISVQEPVTAPVTVDVTDGRVPPMLRMDFYNVREEGILTTTAANHLLVNDGLLDSNGLPYDPILEMSVTNVRNGTLTNYASGDGNFTFQPDPDFSGLAGFQYRLRDKDGWSAPTSVNISVAEDLPFPPLTRLFPEGSQLHRSISNSIAFPAPAAEGDYSIALKAGQTLSVRGQSTANVVLGRLEILDPSGSPLPGGTASPNSLELVPIPADGIYKIRAGQRPSAGNVTFTLLVNGGLPGFPVNPAAPYPLESARPPGSLRAAVAATMTSIQPHQYTLTGAANEMVHLYLHSNLIQTFRLTTLQGGLVASSMVPATDDRAAFLNAVLPAEGTYRVVVNAPPSIMGTDYTLQFFRGGQTHEYAAATSLRPGQGGAGFLAGRGVAAGGNPEPSLTFASFADYGSGSASEAAVAAMVHSWNPDFIIAAGDHNYELDYMIGTPSWNLTVGQFYGRYIKGRLDNRYPEQTSPVQRFFPVPGNHDTGPNASNGGELSSYMDYFHVNPGGLPRLPAGVHQPQLSYYKISQGPADFFFLDSDNAAVNGAARTTQREWLKAQIQASTARWKFAVFHQPPFSSGAVHGNHPYMQWGSDFAGLTAIITGHDHIYERLNIGFGVTQFIVGIGGRSFYNLSFATAQGSQFRYNSNHGALRTVVGADGVQFDFLSIGATGGRLIDSWTIGSPPSPVVPSGSDTWSLHVRRGDHFQLSTRMPPAPGSLTNGVDPLIQLVDHNGTIVASDAGSAIDGRNARLVYRVPDLPEAPADPLPWTIRVLNESKGSGEYELHVKPSGLPDYQTWADGLLSGLSTSPGDDPDMDGLPTLMEYLTDTHPGFPPSSREFPLSLVSGPPPRLQINLPAVWTRPVTVYLQSSSQLDAAGWTTLASKSPGNLTWQSLGPPPPQPDPAGGYAFTPSPEPRKFYRLALVLD